MSAPVLSKRRCISYGSVAIPYSLAFSDRRDLTITVHPDLEVAVVAPFGAALDEIDRRIRSRAPWILRQRLRFEDLRPLPTPRRFVSGETHRYLGRQYRLRVVQSPLTGVKLERPYLVVAVPDRTDAHRVERLVQRWLRAKAQEVFSRRVEYLLTAHPVLRAPCADVRVCRMHRRWGSCAASGTITLNPELVRAPTACIDYVIAHELCHRRVMNHGPRFLRLLTEIMPDWQRRRERLNRLLL